MDVLVIIWAILAYIFDFIKDTITSLAQPFVLGMIWVTLVVNILKNHLDRRLDSIETRLDEIEDRLSRK